MEINEKDIIKTITDIINSFWNDEKRPLLLSSLPSKLKEIGVVNYKEIINNVPLKDFIENTSSKNSYKLVMHETQRAKIGIIPASESFDFSGTQSKEEYKREPKIVKSEKVTIDFIKLLSSLSNEELDSIVIPTRILVKLISKQ